jgi:CRP-like cAMP-binding protein
MRKECSSFQWVDEIGDLSRIRKAEVESVKAFASRAHDRARPAYGRQPVELPRRSIIFGTTNDSTYLKSRTGNRRFWPVKTPAIDIEASRRDRDRLLAEAATVEASGCSLTLPTSLWSDAKAVRDERLEHDPRIDKLASLEGTIFPGANGHGEEGRISCDEILGQRHARKESDSCRGPRTADAVAISDCEMFVIERRDFLPLVREEPEIALKLIEILCGRLRQTTQQVESLMFLQLPSRLAKTRLRLSGGGGVARERKVPVTQKDLANTIGMSRESTNRKLRLWAENKWVRLERGGITILSVDALERIAESDF